jgi:VWFA-related protein
LAELNSKKAWTGWVLGVFLCFLCMGITAQPQPQQDIPDAPSAVQPPPPAKTPPPVQPEEPKENTPAENPAAPRTTPSPEEPPPNSETPEATQPPPPMPPVETVPAGSVPPEAGGSKEDLYRLAVNVNYVQVPVTVKNYQGQLVAGLLSKDFVVLEDGKKQQLRFFSSDPFPLSAAVILDFGMPDVAVQKVNRTFPALQGAFTQFDQVSLYSFSSTVSQLADFSAVNQKLAEMLNQAKTYHGSPNGPPVTSGPLASGPNVNGHPVDSPVQPVITPPKESRVLNDALLRAALDLSKQDKTRRKIIFIISDGREFGSNASYKDVLKVLLSNNIIVYGVGVEGAALPGYGKLQRLTHLPRYGYSDILPKYANATGGEVFNELTSSDIEQVYAAAIGEARNQYTLGYTTRLTPSSRYREIEVRVRRPDVKVYAKAGYYPLPPGR